MIKAVAKPIPPGESRKQANILLVDDQPGKLMTYEAILKDLGANLVAASSAREALEQLLKREFAVVIVDVCMPELDGFDLAEMIRDHPRFRETAIIFVSGVHLTDVDRLKGYERGAVDYLPVPIVPEILRAKVSVFVDLHLKTRELERLNRSLERRVAQRTAELEEAARRKDEFLAVLAHELRNPLAAIQMAATSIGLPDATSTRTHWAGVIDRQVAHLSRLIDDLVDVSRITRGTIELQRLTLDLAGTITAAVEAARPLIEERRHVLTVTLPPERLTLMGDNARLIQVVSNLLNNAAKYTPKDGRIAVSASREGQHAVLRVADNGIGIDPELVPSIFEMFSQVGRPLDRPSPGLGIGLALVRTLVDMHGGSVSARSDGPGTGTELIVRLPLCEGTDTGPAMSSDPPSALQGLPPSRILVVDDNADAADGLAFMLRAAGHLVATANDGLEALEVSPGFRPQIVLLDLGMPKLNGYATAGRIREQPWGQDVVLIALTGWGQPKDRERTARAGFNAHLVKPVAVDELVGVLSELRLH